MTAQEPPEQPQAQAEEQGKGEAPNLIKRIQGWSRRKKILWGMVVGCLFLVCVAVAVAEPVEEDDSTEASMESQEEGVDCSSEEFRKYALAITIPLSKVPNAAGEFERLFGEAANSPALLLSKEWQDDMEENHKVVNDFVSGVRDAKPPESIRHIHAILLEAVDELDKSSNLTREGVRELDLNQIESGASHFQLFVEKFGEYNAELRDFRRDCESELSVDNSETPERTEDVDIEEAQNLPTAEPATSPTAEPTATPKPEVSEEDRIAGKHCMSEFKIWSKQFLQGGMQEPISDRWYGYDPASLEMTEFEIYPLGSELHSVFMERERYGDPWRNHEEHVARAEFTVKTDEGRRVKHTAVYWVRNDNCKIVLIDFD
ncbi:MAG: hypothetical protein OXH22_11565 [Chloroflexi bacterium]|nr:hypothetical protein [Chloroflexota bacterium]